MGRDFVAGVYPMLKDETCRFLAADFDKEAWADDAQALLETCRARGIAAALERSRSGNGAHVWIFFADPVPARSARQLGVALITETMERRPEIGFASYDRLFPNQDTMPAGGFGNLIALPLQRRAREQGNSVFIDDELQPHDDQWAFLSSLPRLSPAALERVVEEAEREGRVLAVRMPVQEEHADEPRKMAPSRRSDTALIKAPLPEAVGVVVADQVYIERTELPAEMTTQAIRLAAFQNPEFYRAQAMRLPTWGKPRIISCAELHLNHVALPRGCLDDALTLLKEHGIDAELIGTIGGGRRKPIGIIDVAMIQSLARKGEVADLVADYGHLVVDECHHLSAASFELVARRAKARFVLGLSATVTRKNGHHPIIFMQCGPVRHQASAREQAAEHGIRHRVRERLRDFGFRQHCRLRSDPPYRRSMLHWSRPGSKSPE